MTVTQLYEIYATAMAEHQTPVRGWKYLNPKERAAFTAFHAQLALRLVPAATP